jgi:hypothetical protein
LLRLALRGALFAGAFWTAGFVAFFSGGFAVFLAFDGGAFPPVFLARLGALFFAGLIPTPPYP